MMNCLLFICDLLFLCLLIPSTIATADVLTIFCCCYFAFHYSSNVFNIHSIFSHRIGIYRSWNGTVVWIIIIKKLIILSFDWKFFVTFSYCHSHIFSYIYNWLWLNNFWKYRFDGSDIIIMICMYQLKQCVDDSLFIT